MGESGECSSRGQPAPEQPWMATSPCPRKQRLTCWGAVDRVAGQVSRLLSPCSPTPGFQDHRLEARLEAHHAAMDFSSPSGGRIISDPREAAAVSRSPSSRPPPLLRPHMGASTSSLVPPHTPGPELSAAWFRPQMGREQANLALFPHRQTTGLFLVRASSRSQQSFVLSFTTQGKIVHAQIVAVPGGDSSSAALSLDGGRTKFAGLPQLVEFHQMNPGPLPCLLTSPPS